jgi:hypothetical protein
MFGRIRLVLIIGIVLLLAGCFAQFTPQLLNTPYQEPIESQHQFSDVFETSSTLGSKWQRIAGWWRISKGFLFQTLPWKSSLPGEFQMIYVDGLASGPYVVETRLSLLNEGEQAAGILFRFKDQNNFYLLRLRHFPRWQDYVDLSQYVNGERREDFDRKDLSVIPGEWHTLRIEDRGNEIIAFMDRKELFRHTPADKATGTVGLAVRTARVAFDYFKASMYVGTPDPATVSLGSESEPLSLQESNENVY